MWAARETIGGRSWPYVYSEERSEAVLWQLCYRPSWNIYHRAVTLPRSAAS